ncbi:MAG: hypothetical protein M3P98_02190 [bacterium]|nr:hypothetical protein [bacterium]
MREQLANKKIIFAIIFVFSIVILGLAIIFGIGIFGEPKNPEGITTEKQCRDKGGIVLESEKNLCQLPNSDSFEVD